MEPTQIAGKVSCGDPPATSNEILEARVTVVDVLDMEFATNAFYGRPVECLVADTRGGGTWWIAGIAVAHRQCILVHDQRGGLPRGIGVDRGQNGTDGRAGAVLTALPATATVSPLARHSPNVSQSSLRYGPFIGVPVTVLTGSIAGSARIALKSPRLAVGHCDPCAPQCGQILSSPTPVSTAASTASPAGRPARTSPASTFRASLNLSTSDNHVRNASRFMPFFLTCFSQNIAHQYDTRIEPM